MRRCIIRPRYVYIAAIWVTCVFALAGAVGWELGLGVLHPARLNRLRLTQTEAMLERADTTKEVFFVTTTDGTRLFGWKIRAHSPNGNWILMFHGLSDNRTGDLGVAELLLRHGYSVIMMDSRAHGESGGSMATYGWKERFDTVAITNALYSQENVHHLGAFGVSMGAAIALQSAPVESRIEAVVAEDPFADLREVSYDYAGMHFSPLLGKTLFRPATIFGMEALANAGGFSPDDVSPVKAVAARAFAVLLICGTRDRVIPCRHAERIYAAARGPRELWIVPGAAHASALGRAPAEYEDHVIRFLANTFSCH